MTKKLANKIIEQLRDGEYDFDLDFPTIGGVERNVKEVFRGYDVDENGHKLQVNKALPQLSKIKNVESWETGRIYRTTNNKIYFQVWEAYVDSERVYKIV